jgi:hemolysin III
MFAISSVYHGLPKGMPKQVMRVVDHCNIFLTIAGTYTPIMLIGVLPLNPTMAWSIFAVEWVCALIGIVLNAIDLKKYARFSMCCYLAMGWCVVISLRDTITGLTWPGFAYILAGGIAYTIGAVLYGVGKRKPYRHFVFHIFVVIAAVVQFIGIWKYLL